MHYKNRAKALGVKSQIFDASQHIMPYDDINEAILSIKNMDFNFGDVITVKVNDTVRYLRLEELDHVGGVPGNKGFWCDIKVVPLNETSIFSIPNEISIHKGSKLYMSNDALCMVDSRDYYFNWVSSKGISDDRGFLFKDFELGESTVSVNIRDAYGNLIHSANIVVHAVDLSNSLKEVLFIGDGSLNLIELSKLSPNIKAINTLPNCPNTIIKDFTSAMFLSEGGTDICDYTVTSTEELNLNKAECTVDMEDGSHITFIANSTGTTVELKRISGVGHINETGNMIIAGVSRPYTDRVMTSMINPLFDTETKSLDIMKFLTKHNLPIPKAIVLCIGLNEISLANTSGEAIMDTETKIKPNILALVEEFSKVPNVKVLVSTIPNTYNTLKLSEEYGSGTIPLINFKRGLTSLNNMLCKASLPNVIPIHSLIDNMSFRVVSKTSYKNSEYRELVTTEVLADETTLEIASVYSAYVLGK